MINDFMQTMNDPHARHALLVHWPIVLGLLGFAPLLGLAFTKWKSTPMKVVCIAWFLAASLAAGLSSGAGEDAMERVERSTPPLTGAESMALEEHEELGEGGWMWPLIPAVLTVFTLAPDRRLRAAAGTLALVAALGVGVWVGVTAHAGGRLVYVHGLGVPARGAGPAAGAVLAPESGGHAPENDHE